MPSWTQVSKLGKEGDGEVSCSQTEGRETQGDVRDPSGGGKETDRGSPCGKAHLCR